MYLEIILFVLFIVYLMVEKLKNLKNRERLPPGESGWPIIGYIPPSNITFRDVILKMGRKHGKIFT
ncbi:UNVERIFIED_CONTAM: hypothetical protein RMT77_010725 [Armadillidium vulgare]